MCIKPEQSCLQQEWKFENWFVNSSHPHRNVSFYIFPTYLLFLRREAETEYMEREGKKSWRVGKLEIGIQKYPMRNILDISNLALEISVIILFLQKFPLSVKSTKLYSYEELQSRSCPTLLFVKFNCYWSCRRYKSTQNLVYFLDFKTKFSVILLLL